MLFTRKFRDRPQNQQPARQSQPHSLDSLESRTFLSASALPDAPAPAHLGHAVVASLRVGHKQVAAARTGHPYAYTLTDITPYRAMDGYGVSINDIGAAVGYLVPTPGVTHAFGYRGGKTFDLGTLGGTSSRAMGVNMSNVVVGWSQASDGSGHAFIYQGDAMSDLGDGNETYSVAAAINSFGTTVGWANAGADQAVSFAGGRVIGLGSLGGASHARAINRSGLVVGDAIGDDGKQYAMQISGSRMLALPGLGGSGGTAAAVNDTGQIVGDAVTTKGGDHAFLYSAGRTTDLGVLPNGASSQATGINNAQTIVGWSSTGRRTPQHAFIYTKGAMTDLNALISPTLGWTLMSAMGINNSGQIVGYGIIGRRVHGFILTPNK